MPYWTVQFFQAEFFAMYVQGGVVPMEERCFADAIEFYEVTFDVTADDSCLDVPFNKISQILNQSSLEMRILLSYIY